MDIENLFALTQPVNQSESRGQPPCFSILYFNIKAFLIARKVKPFGGSDISSILLLLLSIQN